MCGPPKLEITKIVNSGKNFTFEKEKEHFEDYIHE